MKKWECVGRGHVDARAPNSLTDRACVYRSLFLFAGLLFIWDKDLLGMMFALMFTYIDGSHEHFFG